jgi:hypothetical protein
VKTQRLNIFSEILQVSFYIRDKPIPLIWIYLMARNILTPGTILRTTRRHKAEQLTLQCWQRLAVNLPSKRKPSQSDGAKSASLSSLSENYSVNGNPRVVRARQLIPIHRQSGRPKLALTATLLHVGMNASWTKEVQSVRTNLNDDKLYSGIMCVSILFSHRRMRVNMSMLYIHWN